MAKTCGGHNYHIICPVGYSCYCSTDSIWTTDLTVDCSDYNGILSKLGSVCGAQ